MGDRSFDQMSTLVAEAAHHTMVLISLGIRPRQAIDRIDEILREVSASESSGIRLHLDRLLEIRLKRNQEPIVFCGDPYDSWHQAVLEQVSIFLFSCWTMVDSAGCLAACDELMNQSGGHAPRWSLDARCKNWSLLDSDANAWGRLTTFLTSQSVLANELRLADRKLNEERTLLRLFSAGPASEAQTTSDRDRCRLRVETTPQGDFIHCDGTRYPANEYAAKAVQAAIEARDWVSAGEFGCKTDHLNSLPNEIQSLIERMRAKGMRLRPEGWPA